MAKAKSRFVCRDCGAVYPKWQGQCHECGAWNTLEEEAAPVAPPRAGKFSVFHALISPRKSSGSPVSVSSSRKMAQMRLTH